MTNRKLPSRRPPLGTEARDEFNRQMLGPEIVNLLTAIHNYVPGGYPEELLRTAGIMLMAPHGLVGLKMNEESRGQVGKIIDGEIGGTTYGDVAHAIRRWAATFKENGDRLH